MTRIIIVAAVVITVIIALIALFVLGLYKVGESMHMFRCGWREPHDRGSI